MPIQHATPLIRLLQWKSVHQIDFNIGNLGAAHWRLLWHDRMGSSVDWDGGSVYAGPEQMVLIPPNTNFSYHQTRPITRLFIHFLVSGHLQFMEPEVFVLTPEKPVLDQALELHQLSEAGGFESQAGHLAALSLIAKALSLLPPEKLTRPVAHPRLMKVLEKLDESHTTTFSNKALAKMAGMHLNAFIRLFSQQLGVSPQDYSRKRRIEHACYLMQHENKSIKEISGTCRFSSTQHFSKVFKKIQGMSPTRFKQSMRVPQPPVTKIETSPDH